MTDLGLAHERTRLACWRTALSTLALVLAVAHRSSGVPRLAAVIAGCCALVVLAMNRPGSAPRDGTAFAALSLATAFLSASVALTVSKSQ